MIVYKSRIEKAHWQDYSSSQGHLDRALIWHEYTLAIITREMSTRPLPTVFSASVYDGQRQIRQEYFNNEHKAMAWCEDVLLKATVIKEKEVGIFLPFPVRSEY